MDLRLFSTSILVVSFLLSFNAHLQSSEVDEESFFDIQVDNDDNEFFEIQINDDELEEVEGVSFSIDGSIKQGITYGLDSPSQLFTRNKKGIETVSTEVFLISEGKPSENTKIKVSGLEHAYVKRFSKPAKSLASVQALVDLISQAPRYLLEAIAFGGMMLVALYLMVESENFTEAVPVIAKPSVPSPPSIVSSVV